MKRLLFLFLFLASFVKAQTVLPVKQGGQGRNTLTPNYLLIGNGTNPVTLLAPGTDGQVLSISSGVPTWIDAGSGSGTVSSVALSLPNIFSVSGSPVTTSGTLSATLASQLQNLVFAAPSSGSGTPSFRILASSDIPALNYENPLTFSTGLTRSVNTITVNTTQNITKFSNLTSNGFVKTSGGDGTLSIDGNTYLTGNESITLSGDVSGSGATAITTTIGNAKVTNAMLAGSIAYSKLSLTGAILNADLAGSIAYSKLSLTGAILNADLAGSIAASKLIGSDIATVGTITSGTWHGGTIDNAYLTNTAVANLSGTNTGDQTTVSGNAGTATALQTAHTIYGNSFNGTADLTQIIASTYGGTGNGFTKFTGALTSEKTYTLPNASAAILTDNAVVTVAQGGTGIGTLAVNGVLYGNTTSAIQALAVNSTATNKFLTQSSSNAPAWNTLVSGDIPNNGANTTGSAAKWTTARNLAGNSVDGSANVAFSNNFIVQGTTDAGLSGAQFLGSLGTGIVKNTTTTGVLSIAVNSDLPVMTATVGGAVPTPPNNTTTFLRGDGTFAAPGGSGTVTSVDVAIGGMASSGAITTSGTITMTGTLDINRGGTGNSSYTNGQLLIGNTSGNTLTKATLTGTSNQVTVTNGTGSITLSTPQDIHTSATPQFSRLGLGQAADGTAVFAGLQAVAANTVADGFLLANSNAATSGNQMFSPSQHLTAYGFGTTAGTSQACDFRWDVEPTQSTVPIAHLDFYSSIAGGAYTKVFQIFNNGQILSNMNSLNATQTLGMRLINTTAATSGQKVQVSPSLELSGTADNTSSGDVSETDKWGIYNLPATVAGTTTQSLLFVSSIAGGAFSEKFGITSAGDLRLSGSAITTSGILNIANGGTGNSTYTNGQLLIGNTSGNTLTKATLTGTANEVVVTNGGGTITLSTPQDIATASTPQFARLGLGQAADATAGGAILQSIAANTSADGLILKNSGTASLNNQMFSPRIRLTGNNFNTTGSDSKQKDFIVENQPVQGTVSGSANLIISYQNNAGGYTEVFGINSSGSVRFGGTAGTGLIYGNGASSAPSFYSSGATNGIMYSQTTGLTPTATTQMCLDPTNYRIGIGGGIAGSASYTGHFYLSDAATNAVSTVIGLDHTSSGTPAAGYGSQILVLGKSSTTASQNMGAIAWDWTNPVHASRSAREKHWGVFNASALTDIGTWALTAATTATLTVGLAGTTTGNLNLVNATGSNAISIAAPASPSAYTLTLPTDGGTVGYFARTNGSGTVTWKNNASYQATPATPTGTTDATGKMMGLAGAITPNTSGQVIIIVSGDIANSNALGGCKVQLRYGTGTAPTNGAAATGTALGGFQTLTLSVGANDAIPFSVQGVATGLTVSTAYWIDIQVAATTAGTATPADISISAHEF